MNNKIIEYVNQLKYLILKGNSSDALQKIDDIVKILDNSVIIPKDKLQFEFTKTEDPSYTWIYPNLVHIEPRLKYIECQLIGPKEVFTYDINDKYVEKNEKEFIDHAKEELIKKLIDRWSMNENEDK